MKILVTGATGNIGRAAALTLLKSGHQVTALVRDPARAHDLATAGAIILKGDIEDQTVLNQASAGQDGLFWLTPPNHAAQDLIAWQTKIAHHAILAAKNNHIPRIVHLTALGIDQPHGGKMLKSFRALEALWNESGLSVLHLRPGWFMENLLPQAAPIQSEGRLYVAIEATVPLPLIATADIGATVATRLTADPFKPGFEDLYGPELLTGPQIADVLSKHFNKPLTWTSIPAEAIHDIFLSLGATPQTATLYVELFADFSHPAGPYASTSPNATRTATSLAAFAQEAF